MQYVASLSYGKDSIYMLEIIKQNNLPLDRILHAEIWATETISADLPPMVEFKKRAKERIESRYGVEVEHIRGKYVYEAYFYNTYKKGAKKDKIYGFPHTMGSWCTDRLKTNVLQQAKNKSDYDYIGYAIDEPNPKRQKKIKDYLLQRKERTLYPLVDFGITEQQAFDWCLANDLLSPIYKTANRGGCWFCHNQRIGELRLLRKNYPEYWELMLKWDRDSPVVFMADGRTVRDLDHRFEQEDRQVTFQEMIRLKEELEC